MNGLGSQDPLKEEKKSTLTIVLRTHYESSTWDNDDEVSILLASPRFNNIVKHGMQVGKSR